MAASAATGCMPGERASGRADGREGERPREPACKQFADRSRWNRGAAARGVREDWLGAHGAGGRGWRGGCAGGAARDDSIAPMPPRRRPPGVADEKRRSAGAGTSGRSAPSRPSPVKVRPISGNKGRGRSESAWTAKRQGVKAIWRLPNPRDARRNMRFRKSLDRRKSDAPPPHTAHGSHAHGIRLARTLALPDARPRDWPLTSRYSFTACSAS